MAIAAETNAGTPGAGVTGITKVPVIAMPWPMTVEAVQAGRVNARVGAAHAIGVAMASGAGAGGIIDFMAGSAIFNIDAGRAAVVDSPAQSRVGQGHPVFTLMTVAAKCSSIVATDAIGLFALGLETVSVPVVEIMNIAGLIVALVALNAVNFLLMAGSAPVRFERGLFGVLVPPADRVNVRQRSLVGVTDMTVPGGAKAVVAVHAQRLARHGRYFFALAGRTVTAPAAGFGVQMPLVIEQH